MEFNLELFVAGYLVTGCLLGLLTFLLDDAAYTTGYLLIYILIGCMLGYFAAILYLIAIMAIGIVSLFDLTVFQKRIKR